ncbi:unnamed protein product [Caretta caretta]
MWGGSPWFHQQAGGLPVPKDSAKIRWQQDTTARNWNSNLGEEGGVEFSLHQASHVLTIMVTDTTRHDEGSLPVACWEGDQQQSLPEWREEWLAGEWGLKL